MQVVSVDELSDVVEHRLGCSPNFKYFYDPEKKAYFGKPHQYNCTYYSALGGNPRHYLLARAIQFFTPGIPMVYYVGLFAGLNDYDVSSSQLVFATHCSGMARSAASGFTVSCVWNSSQAIHLSLCCLTRALLAVQAAPVAALRLACMHDVYLASRWISCK